MPKHLVNDVRTALALLDDDPDFGALRDTAPAAYARLEGRAVQALRRLRDALEGAPLRYATPGDWHRAREDQQHDAQGLVLLLADTLRAQLPDAAYLVFHINDSYDTETGRDLQLHSVRAADGTVLHDFRSPLPDLDAERHRGLAFQWRDGRPPRTEGDLGTLMQQLRAAGLILDTYPEQLHLYDHKDYGCDTEQTMCMLLADSAHPEQWDLRDVFGTQLLRPYGTPLSA
ncbi:hypothetical protein [Streptomyces alboflavus]|uniref:hypothetical protein n=1 Tax=Streptomyces alboflavus TaxID=67267 RepID=UPI0013316C01|nr:hypothetical protein [Streptomyces alboflavus]